MQRSSPIEPDDAILLARLLSIDQHASARVPQSQGQGQGAPRFDKLSFDDWSKQMESIQGQIEEHTGHLDTSGSPSSLLQTFLRQHKTPPNEKSLPNLRPYSHSSLCGDSPRYHRNHHPSLPPHISPHRPPSAPPMSAPPHLIIPSYDKVQPLTFSPLSRQMVALNPFNTPVEAAYLPEGDSPPQGVSPSSSRKKRRSSSGNCNLDNMPDRRHSSGGESFIFTGSISQPQNTQPSSAAPPLSLGGSGPQRNKSFPSARDFTSSERQCCPAGTSNVLCRAIVEQQVLFERQMKMIQEDQERLMAESSKQTQTLIAALVAKAAGAATLSRSSSHRRKFQKTHDADSLITNPSSDGPSDSFASEPRSTSDKCSQLPDAN